MSVLDMSVIEDFIAAQRSLRGQKLASMAEVFRQAGFGSPVSEQDSPGPDGAGWYTQSLQCDGQEVALACFECDGEGMVRVASLCWQLADGLGEAALSSEMARIRDGFVKMLGHPYVWLDQSRLWLDSGLPDGEVVFSACWGQGAGWSPVGAVESATTYREALRRGPLRVATLHVTASTQPDGNIELACIVTIFPDQ